MRYFLFIRKSKNRFQSTGVCDRCEESTATLMCIECGKPYCDECNVEVHSRGKWSTHTTYAIGQSPPSNQQYNQNQQSNQNQQYNQNQQNNNNYDCKDKECKYKNYYDCQDQPCKQRNYYHCKDQVIFFIFI